MDSASFDQPAPHDLLPERIIGKVASVTPIRTGLSGAGVYAVVADSGDYILRVQSAQASDLAWTQQLLVMRRAADAGVAPPIVHVDETARATISRRIDGVPLAVALGDPAQRNAAVGAVITQLNALHAIDAAGIEELDGVAYARGAWEVQRRRAGFPGWADDLAPSLDEAAGLLARDTRRVVGHNDVNPGNVLWDGRRAWLVDWEVAALAHPFYDIATFSTFLNLDDQSALGLLALQEVGPVDADARALFSALRRLVAIAVGCTFLALVDDLAVAPAESRDSAPTLAFCYAAMRDGTLDLQTPRGRAVFALAFLRLATSPAAPSAS